MKNYVGVVQSERYSNLKSSKNIYYITNDFLMPFIPLSHSIHWQELKVEFLKLNIYRDYSKITKETDSGCRRA